MRIPIVNEQDEIIGHRDKHQRGEKDIIRITGLWVTSPEGDILLAQRVFTKRHHPGLWGPAAAGTVEEGETYESNAIKEAEEEIGLKNCPFLLGPKLRSTEGHMYFGQWFTAVVDRDYPFVKQDEEVEKIQWFTPEELQKLIIEKPEMFLPGFQEYFDMMAGGK